MRRVRRTHAKFAALNHNAVQDDPDNPVDVPDLGGVGDDVDDRIDLRPWKVPKGLSGVDLGEKMASECLDWMGKKVLEHAGFQGPSSAGAS
jgi:transcriptional activator SPT7